MTSKVCLLIRVSSEKQETRRQLLELTTFCKRNKLKIVRTISSKISGTKTKDNRPELIELLAAAKRKELVGIQL